MVLWLRAAAERVPAGFIAHGAAVLWLIASVMLGALANRTSAQSAPSQNADRLESKRTEPPTSVDLRSKFRGSTENEGTIDYRQRWAVVIGVDEYDPQLNEYGPLTFARKDAQAVLAELRDEFGFQTSEVGTAIRPRADRARIEAVLKNWPPRDKVAADDLVLVFYAGHAATDGDLIGCDGKAVPLIKVVELLSDLPCRHKLLILDSCFSGTLFRIRPGAASVEKPAHTEKGASEPAQNSPPPIPTRPHRSARPSGDVISTYFNEDAFLAISAARTTPAQDGGGDSHSIFTTSLLQTLRERADSTRPDQAFTFRELAARVEARVRDRIGGLQVPDWGRLGPGLGDIVFRPTVWRLTPASGSARRSYAAAMAAAQAALEQNDFARVHELLEDQRPRLGEEDLRGFEWFYLWKLTHTEELLLRGPMEIAKTIAFSHDGRSIVAWYADGSIREWELPSGRIRSTREVRFDDAPPTMTTAKYDFLNICPQPAARIWAVGDPTVGIRIIDFDTSRVLRSFVSGTPTVDPFLSTLGAARSLTPDGSMLGWAGGVYDSQGIPGPRQLRIWRWRARDQDPILVYDIPPPRDAMGPPVVPHVAIEFSPANRRVALATEDSLSLIEIGGPRREQKQRIHEARVSAFAFTPDGSTIVGGTSTGEVWRWDSSNPSNATKLLGPRRWDYSVLRVASDGRKFGAANTSGEVEVRDLRNGDLIAAFQSQIRSVSDLQFSPDCELLASCGGDGTVRLWKLRPSQNFIRFDPFPERVGVEENADWETSIEFSPNGFTLATGMFRLNSSRLTRFWVVGKGSCSLLSTIDGDPPNSHIEGPVFSPTGELVASIFLKNDPLNAPGVFERSAQVHEVRTGRRIAILDASQVDVNFSAGPSRVIEDLAFTADGRSLLVGERSGVISRWAVDGWKPEATPLRQWVGFRLRRGLVSDAKRIAVARTNVRSGGVLEIADLPDGRRVQTVGRAASAPYLCRFSPNGTVLVWASEDRLLHLSGAESSGTPVTLPPAFQSPASEGPAKVLFQPSGQFFVMVTPALELRGHEIHTGREIAVRRKNVAVPLSGRSVTMDREGRSLVSCEEGSIIFMDPATLTERFVLHDPAEQFGEATLSASGTDLAVMAKGGKVVIWHAASRKEANDPVDENITRLKRGDEQERRHAADALGGLGRTSARASPILLDALSDHSPAVRGAAIEALVQIGDPNIATASAFTRMLDDADPDVRRKAVVAFLHLGFAPPEAMDRMRTFLRGRSGALAWVAMQALSRIDSDLDGIAIALLEGIDSKPDVIESPIWTSLVASAAARELRPKGRAVRLVPVYLRLLQNVHLPLAEISLIEGLRRIGSRARSASRAIANKLNSDDKSVPSPGMIALAEISPDDPEHQKRMLEVLAECVASPSGLDREKAVNALGDVGVAARNTLPILMTIENNADWPSEKHQATFAIRRIDADGNTHIGYLVELLGDPDPNLKQLALKRLARFGLEAKESIPRLEQMAKANDPFAAAARDAIDEIRADDEP